EMEQMMATVLPFYLAEPDKPEVAARLAGMSRVMKADLAAGKAWEGGLYQSVDLRPPLGRITSPPLIVAGELAFICGPAQDRPGGLDRRSRRVPAGCGRHHRLPARHARGLRPYTQRRGTPGIPPGDREFPPPLIHTAISDHLQHISNFPSQWHTCMHSHAASR